MPHWRRALLIAVGLAGTAALALLASACLGAGCSSIGYYAQSVGGHLDLMNRARPVAEVAADPATPAAMRERLALTQRMRAFAVAELKLPDNASYTRYADLQRGAAVWNVVAAPQLSLQLKTWCYPVMGCAGYRGYFDRAQADALAAELKSQGWETQVYGVPAYSTLGWSNWLGGDPLLNTFVSWPEGELARLVFHELAHQVAYASDDTMFNESYATAVERLGGRRWLAQAGREAARAEYETLDTRRRAFRELTLRTRRALEAAYAWPGSETERRQRKADAMAAMRAELQALKAGPWQGFAGYDRWFEQANNAAFGVQAAYDELVPAFERLFEQVGGDFARFHAEVQRLAGLPRAQRRAELQAMGDRLPG